MSQLALRFLGPPQVQAGGQPLNFPSRKALALLAYLVVEGETQPRELLAALLWPESDPSRARATLRNALHQLRSTLPDDTFLHIERDALGFNFDADYFLDLEVVESALDDAPAPGDRRAPPPGAPSQLETAVDLTRGDFLAGFTLSDAPDFDDWTSLQRAYFHHRLDDVFDRLSQQQFNRGQIAAAQTTAERWLAHNPLQETAYRRLMQLHLAAGDRPSALQTFERLRQTLADELSVEPTPETLALAERARKANAGTAIERPIPKSATLRQAQDNVRSPQFSQGPLVGRGDAFQMLVERFHMAADGRYQIVGLTGEAGIGKTRLAEEFLAWSAAHDADLLRGRSFESDRQLPYQPLVDALRPRLEQINAPEDLLSDIWLAELSRLLPELLDRYPDLRPLAGPPREETAARTRLFEAITRLTLALAERLPAGAPLILFLDDLQWTDRATLDVLVYAGRRWAEAQTPAMLLFTARPEPAMGEALAGLGRHAPLKMRSLAPLTAEATAAFVAAFGAEADGRLARQLYQATSGQPFYLVETLNDWQERGLLATAVDEAGRWQIRPSAGLDRAGRETAAPVPETVRRLIGSRLARLSSAASDLLAAAAVLGRRVPFALLCRVAGLDEAAGLRALDELLAGQLLREETAVYAFSHDTIRDVAYAEAGAARRQVFHRRALAALADADAPAAQRAFHARAAGDDEAAFALGLAAGDEALHLFAARDAIAQYEQARTASRQLSVGSDPLRRLYTRLGRAYELAGDYDDALAVYDTLQSLARERDDRPLELAALLARTTVYAAPTQYYDPDSARLLQEEALPLARELDDPVAEAKILWNLMLINLFTGDTRQAVADGEASLAIARAHDLQEQMAYALHDLHRAYLSIGQAEQGFSYLRQARELWRALDDKAMLADGLCVEAGMLFLAGEYDACLALSGEALALSRAIDNVWNQSFSQMTMGPVYFDRGQFGRAIAVMTASIELGQRAGFMIPVVASGSLLALVYSLLGDGDRALEWANRSLAQARQMHDSLQTGPLAVQGMVYLAQGELDAAATAVAESQRHFMPEANDFGAALLPLAALQLALAQGRYEALLALADEFEPVLALRGIRPFRADLFYFRGRALYELGRVEAAEKALHEARRAAEALKSRRILGPILETLADWADERGDGETAVALRRQARQVVDFIAGSIEDAGLRERL